MELEFLNELHEARMTRNSFDQAKLTYTDCCERLYLSMLSLELLRRFPGSLPTAEAMQEELLHMVLSTILE